MNKHTIITGGRLSVTRFRHALKLTHDCGYDVVLTLKNIRHIDNITNGSCLIFSVNNQNDFLELACYTIEGILLNECNLVHPSIIICISKKSLGSFIDSISIRRRFNIIDLDNGNWTES